MNCTAVRNLKQAKLTVEKETFINNQLLKYSSGEINRITFIQAVSKTFLPQNKKKINLRLTIYLLQDTNILNLNYLSFLGSLS